MRLHYLKVRNYRVHRETAVTFDPARTLIGGPNESGKSTLVEALQRVFFLRARATGETREEMLSTGGGHPEVEAGFECGGKTWHLTKRFSGATGTTTLTEAGGDTLSGEEAETKLATLLGAETAAGRGAGEKAALQWSHIWVSQGKSGLDPAEEANRRRDALMELLQTGDSTAIMQSALDAKVAAEIAGQWADLFNRYGEPRAGSAFFAAKKEVEAAREGVELAREKLVRLEQAVVVVREAEAAIATAAAAMENLRPGLQQIQRRLEKAAELRVQVESRAAALTLAESHAAALQQADADIRSLRADIAARGQAMAPGEAGLDRLSAAESACRAREAEAETALQEAGKVVREVRQRRELAMAQVQWLERSAERETLLQKQAEAEKLRAERTALGERISCLPAVTEAVLKQLHDLDRECSNAEAAMQAMAAGLEVLAADEPVLLDGQPVSSGDVRLLLADSVLSVGGARLRIRPGGGNSLTEARHRLQQAAAGRQRALDGAGVGSIQEAAEVAAKRRQLEFDLRSLAVRLEAMGDARLDAQCREAQQKCAAAEAEVERRSAVVEGLPVPESLIAARVLVDDISADLSTAETREAAARAGREAAAKALRAAGEAHAAARQRMEEARREAADAAAKLEYLLQSHGGDDARAAALAERLAVRDAAAQQVSGVRQTLAALQPDLLSADLGRLQRALHQQEEIRRDAETKLAVAQSQLVSDGTSDPQAEFLVAKERQQTAEKLLEVETRKARAVHLLHELFQTARQELADRFTRPLAEKVAGYLECLYGPGARAEVRLEDNQFSTLKLVRPALAAGAFEFASLSGGAREQLAAAFRLAMAEVLAAGFDGCLPVIFDDAFAYADPDRVQVLQRMLDLAAARGLQVIVLTCTPGDYAGLGARHILLPPPGRPLP